MDDRVLWWSGEAAWRPLPPSAMAQLHARLGQRNADMWLAQRQAWIRGERTASPPLCMTLHFRRLNQGETLLSVPLGAENTGPLSPPGRLLSQPSPLPLCPGLDLAQ
ncbi:hypothetical protein DPEC_G00210510 [Dallia pectoralis]|uniref:Uncharacterized protein n=1 Tax=Dallia pectoralis TaxID=75939 RepID=A0ACC2G5U3_DALPE|nr:hypothetical protein DPEC_G00210510 [Dallia pectoralis]